MRAAPGSTSPRRVGNSLLVLALAPLWGCSGVADDRPPIVGPLARLFPATTAAAERVPSCIYASPVGSESGDLVLLAAGSRASAYEPESGALRWSVLLPAPDGEQALAVSTPLRIGDRLFVSYHTIHETPQNVHVTLPRHRHRVAVIDVQKGALDQGFELLELAGSVPAAGGGRVHFAPGQALGRAQLVRLQPPGSTLGRLYVTFGNARDIQPWHGFAFEIDLDHWYATGATGAVRALFVTTPEADCGPPGASGSRERVCGGGLWAPSGPLVLPGIAGAPDALILAAGNGQLDLARGDYANTLLRLPAGLQFDPGCDSALCAGSPPGDPDRACSESCANLFIPRLPDGEDFSRQVSRDRCAGLSLFDCWGRLDYIGGSTPAVMTTSRGRSLLYPAKDGAVYLVDADHLGTLQDRVQLVPVCGTATAECDMDWAGMIVTQPLVVDRDAGQLAIVPTFMPDSEQEAGVVALRIEDGPAGVPSIAEVWRFPPAGSAAARQRFRHHPSRASLWVSPAGRPLALLVEARTDGQPGRLLGLDVDTGEAVIDSPLLGPGYRFVAPLVLGDRVFVPSCESNTAGDAWLEGYRLTES